MKLGTAEMCMCIYAERVVMMVWTDDAMIDGGWYSVNDSEGNERKRGD
jgi:hypothetical protein